MTYLPDVNVWLALTVDGHPHHRLAMQWLDRNPSEPLVFCRITLMGLLRLLTNTTVMGGAPLTAATAWGVVDALLADPRIDLLREPPNFEEHWRRTSRAGKIGPNFWMDAYLASLCAAAGCTLVTFDRALAKRKGIPIQFLSRS